MRLSILLLLTALPFFGICQGKKGYFSTSLGLNFAKMMDPAVGGHISGNAMFAPGCFTGLELGFVKFQGMDGIYMPLQLKITVMPGKDPSKISPIAFLQPGYGVYNKTAKVSNTAVTTTQGGFVFFGGAGLAFGSQGKGRMFLALGYSRFGFTINDRSSPVDMVSVRTGVMLQ